MRIVSEKQSERVTPERIEVDSILPVHVTDRFGAGGRKMIIVTEHKGRTWTVQLSDDDALAVFIHLSKRAATAMSETKRCP